MRSSRQEGCDEERKVDIQAMVLVGMVPFEILGCVNAWQVATTAPFDQPSPEPSSTSAGFVSKRNCTKTKKPDIPRTTVPTHLRLHTSGAFHLSLPEVTFLDAPANTISTVSTKNRLRNVHAQPTRPMPHPTASSSSSDLAHGRVPPPARKRHLDRQASKGQVAR